MARYVSMIRWFPDTMVPGILDLKSNSRSIILIRLDIGPARGLNLYRMACTALCCSSDMATGYPLYRQFNKMLSAFSSRYSSPGPRSDYRVDDAASTRSTAQNNRSGLTTHFCFHPPALLYCMCVYITIHHPALPPCSERQLSASRSYRLGLYAGIWFARAI